MASNVSQNMELANWSVILLCVVIILLACLERISKNIVCVFLETWTFFVYFFNYLEFAMKYKVYIIHRVTLLK